jgi:hypothetical protein
VSRPGVPGHVVPLDPRCDAGIENANDLEESLFHVALGLEHGNEDENALINKVVTMLPPPGGMSGDLLKVWLVFGGETEPGLY